MSTTAQSAQLPIYQVMHPLREALSLRDEVVLQAPPGAGKTTAVPVSLLQEPWLDGQKILVLEPRRVAARAAAQRMAELLGEPVGETVGYRIRLETCVSEATRIEVITEGILTRQLQNDPGLEGVGLVIFDEFHERNLHSDLGLALTLQGRAVFRECPALKLLVMSATLDGAAVSELLWKAPIISSDGRSYPVETHYGDAMSTTESIVRPVADLVVQALAERSGSVLVFLPGQGEINRVARELLPRLEGACDEQVIMSPLYGGLSIRQQQHAIAPAPEGKRKVVLATNIAETSLTIEGIHTVVDSGLARVPVFDPATGMTRLDTRRISRSSAEQRRGRAGRLGPGHCYRLWSVHQQSQLVEHASPEILQADLSQLALQLLAWGVDDPSELVWLDPPPAGPFAQAVSLLESCGAVYQAPGSNFQLTPHGLRMAQLPLHPRLAHMLLVACDINARETACLLAALLSERNPLSAAGVDLEYALSVLKGEAPCPKSMASWSRRTRSQSARFESLCEAVHKSRKFALDVAADDVLGVLLASAYPDRIARKREGRGDADYQLSNGRSAVLPAADKLAGEPWLAVAEVGGQVGESADRIYSAVALNPECFQEILSPLVRQEDYVDWDERRDQFVAERRTYLGMLLLSSEGLPSVSQEAREQALLGLVRKRGLSVLGMNDRVRQWCARVNLLRALDTAQGDGAQSPWPDMSDDGLLASLEHWLAPYLGDVRRLEDFSKLDVKALLGHQLAWPASLELERLAPEQMVVPSGSSIRIDYSHSPPILAVKLQEMFGCAETPCIADGRIALVVHLLSPAKRPLQVTQDLASFWRNGYVAVRKEMKGRYPKHPWPEDPMDAPATRHTRKRMQRG